MAAALSPELDRDYGVKWTELKVVALQLVPAARERDRQRASGVRAQRLGVRPAGHARHPPRFEHRETEWGMELKAIRIEPTTSASTSCTSRTCIHIRAPVLTRGGGPTAVAGLVNWYVPVDDETSVLFSARSAPVLARQARRFEERLPPHRYYNPADRARRSDGQPALADDPTSRPTRSGAGLRGAARPGPHRRPLRGAAGEDRRWHHPDAQPFPPRDGAVQRGVPGKRWQPKTDPTPLPLPPGVLGIPVLA